MITPGLGKPRATKVHGVPSVQRRARPMVVRDNSQEFNELRGLSGGEQVKLDL
jgi:hypothetical protein